MFGFQITSIFTFSYFVICLIPLCPVSGAYIGMEIPDKLLTELYSSYKEALNIDEGTVSFRRVFTDKKKYQIHVMKLNEVNGNKRHNLLIKDENATNPLIYINNPVETKLPNAYLTFEEFKKELTDRVLRLREEFTAKTKKNYKIATKNAKAKSKTPAKKVTTLLRNQTVRKQPKPSVKPNKSKTAENPVFSAKTTLKVDTGYVTNQTNKITKKLIALTSSTTQINNNVTQQSYSKETTETTQKDITKNNVVAGSIIETSLEPPKVTIVTENPIEAEVTNLSGQYEPTEEYEVDSTTKSDDIATPVEVTETIKKSTKLSRPLVWMNSEK